MIFMIKAAQLVLALVILVTIHEFGHYLFARIFGIKVEKFYLFFNPWFSLVTYDPMKGTVKVLSRNADESNPDPKALCTFKVGRPHNPRPDGKPTWRDTIYGLGWLPLGGYCSIAGMVDETKSASDLGSEPQPWEFRSKAAYKRLMVMVAGVLFNFLLAIVIYIGIAMHWGDYVIPFRNITEGMDFVPEMQAVGFRNGDILASIDGKPMDNKDYTLGWDMLQPGARIGVLRNGNDTVITIPDELIKEMVARNTPAFSIRVPVYVQSVVPGEGAAAADLRPDDHIVAVGSTRTPSFTEFVPALLDYKDTEVALTVLRGDSVVSVPVHVNDAGKIGIGLKAPQDVYRTEQVSYNLIMAIPRGINIGVGQLTTYVSSLGLVFTKEGAKSLGGFGTLGSLFPDRWNWFTFWNLTAFLSIILAFMNILPIPALDGGYTLFLLVEMVTRRKPSDRFLEIANTIGFFLLLALLLFANGNDLYRFFK